MSLFDVTLFATAFATLTVIMDPIGTVPVFLGLTARYSQPKQRRAAIQATSVSFEGVNVALVPLGTPLLAGPGSIVAVMVAVGQAGTNVGSWIAVIVAVVLAHVVMWLTMRFSLVVSRFLGPGGIMLLTKISGLLLAAIATQLIMEGIFQFIAAAHLG